MIPGSYAAIEGGPVTVFNTEEADLDNSERSLFDDGWKPEVFKTADDAYLKLWYKKPAEHDNSGQTPAIVFFYGGGWRGRNMTHFQKQGEHLAKTDAFLVSLGYLPEK